MKIRFNSMLIDKLGISASLLCAIHCAAIPILVTFLPMWGLDFLAHEGVEAFMICLSLLIALMALSATYRKHKNWLPAFVLLFGFGLIGIGHYAEPFEFILVPIGGATIALAHILNIKLTKKCAIHSNLNQTR